MEINRKDLKLQARMAMYGCHPPFWLITLLYLLLTTGLSTLVSSLLPVQVGGEHLNIAALFSTILVFLLCLVMDFGFVLWSMACARGEAPTLTALFDGFSETTSVILMNLLIFLYTFGWSLMGAVPLSMLTSGILLTVSQRWLFTLLLLLLIAGAAAYAWSISLRYALAPYLLADYPDQGAGAAVRRSVFMMRGWKWELFKLQFSFLGWHVLEGVLMSAAAFAALALGLSGLSMAGLFSSDPYGAANVIRSALALPLVSLLTVPLQLWLKPYTSVANALFYDLRSQSGPVDPPPLNMDPD